MRAAVGVEGRVYGAEGRSLDSCNGRARDR